MPQNIGGEGGQVTPSMKVPPKRKGNAHTMKGDWGYATLNESPSEKEGK